MSIEVNFIPAHLAISQEMIPIIARALAGQRKRDATDGIVWPIEWVQVAEELSTYADVIVNAKEIEDSSENVTSTDLSVTFALTSDEVSHLSDVKTYAIEHSLDEANVRRACRAGRLDAIKIDNEWKIRVPA
jgi:hypothetical protein